MTDEGRDDFLSEMVWSDRPLETCSTTSVGRICGGVWWPVGPHSFALCRGEHTARAG
ncbi:hypothetical protein [Streptomyces sp. NPDC087525]|uniref:hypothetical protein n=1 Tax=Streptomyces sp. NPDC087525 TaxID=3365793 RepID=UPI003829DE4C